MLRSQKRHSWTEMVSTLNVSFGTWHQCDAFLLTETYKNWKRDGTMGRKWHMTKTQSYAWLHSHMSNGIYSQVCGRINLSAILELQPETSDHNNFRFNIFQLYANFSREQSAKNDALWYRFFTCKIARAPNDLVVQSLCRVQLFTIP